MPIRGKTLRPSNTAVLKVYIDEYGKDVFSGRVLSSHIPMLCFAGVYNFLEKLEEFYNLLDFPQATHDYRTFINRKTKLNRSGLQQDNLERMEVLEKVEDKGIKIEPAGKGTFIIKVLYRQNATWQGNIQWVEGKKAQNFRSDLEMLKLIDEALNNGAKEEVKWEEIRK